VGGQGDVDVLEDARFQQADFAAAALLGALFGYALPAAATVFEPRDFSRETHPERYHDLIEELRCLVCQNQNLKDSDAPLARDMRRELRRMVESGASEADVKQFLLDRYGDFALYRPRLAPNTLLLWFGPGAIVVFALGATAFVIRRRMKMPIPEED